MKKKLMGLGLVLSLGIAAGAATLMSMKEPAVMTKADDPSGVTLYMKANSNWTQSSARFAINYFSNTIAANNHWADMALVSGESDVYKVTVPVTSGESFDTIIFVRMNPSTTENNWTNKWNQTNDLTYKASEGNLYTIADGTWDKGGGAWSAYSEPVLYAISEYAVVDGTAEATAFATENAGSASAFTPKTVNRTGFFFDDWYTDAACTSKYVAKIWTETGNLYAKYTTVSARTIYFKTAGWASTYVYAFGGDVEFGAWPGTATTASDATNGVAYQGSFGIIKVTLAKNDTKIIFSNGTGGANGTTQTNDLKIANGAYYWVDAEDGSTGDADKGSGAQVVFDINKARCAVAEASPILAGSLCGISKATAESLLTEYGKLNATAKGYVDSATDYVYQYDDTTKNVNVTFDKIIDQLRIIANKSSSPAAITGIGDSAWAPAWIALISLSVAALASAGLLISRRKHE